MAGRFSIIEGYYRSLTGHSCGYCNSPDTNYSNAMWTDMLTVQDYQDLIDRGWRRSGCYCYKPVLHLSCCPMYTIKCEALNFIISKSQKKTLKRMGKFLKGELIQKGRKEKEGDYNDIDVNMRDALLSEKCSDRVNKDSVDVKMLSASNSLNVQSKKVKNKEISLEKEQKPPNSESNIESTEVVVQPKQSIESTSSKGPFRKAKLMRIERKRNKLLAQGKTLEEIEAMFQARRKRNQPKSFEELFEESCRGNKNLELRLVSVTSKEFKRTFKESLKLYQKYQMTIHKQSLDKCSESGFLDFLVTSPLQHSQPDDGPPHGYGSFHEQYWLDNKLIAIAVIDILPSCVSSVYFFYDPDYSFLTLGTYSSLREVYLTRQLNKIADNLKYYYMGFYIHTCPKMRYKARMKPSKLLCPETYVWLNIEPCLAKLDEKRYCRFNDDTDVTDEDGSVDIQQVLILHRQIGMTFGMYEATQGTVSREEKEEIQEFANLVGKKCVRRMLLYRD